MYVIEYYSMMSISHKLRIVAIYWRIFCAFIAVFERVIIRGECVCHHVTHSQPINSNKLYCMLNLLVIIVLTIITI